MVQRKVPKKPGVQANHVKSDKCLASVTLSSPQHQDDKSRGIDRKKKMKESVPIKFPDMEDFQSPPLRRNLSQEGKPPPLHVPAAAASTQKQKKPLARKTDGSPNYMKPTTSSDAKKELFPRSTQSDSNGKNLSQKCWSASKASSVSSNKYAKTLTRASSLDLERTLAKTPSFKPSRTCPPRKSTTEEVLCADVNAMERATCSSTLKQSKFPASLLLNPGGTETEGASIMNVCPYTYCSLNGGHHHAPLPPLKSFMSTRRDLLKTQKSVKLESLSPQQLKVPGETKKDTDAVPNVFDDGKYEAETGNPIISPLEQETIIAFFIEIYIKEKEGADETGKTNFAKDLEDQEDIKSAIEKNGIAAAEHACVPNALPFDDVAVDADTKGSFHQEQNDEDADENHPTSWSHEEICMGSYCSEVSYDEEQTQNIELGNSNSQYSEMEWEEENFHAFDWEEDIDSSVFTNKETDLKYESLSESSHDVSANEEEITCFEGESMEFETQETDYPSNDITCDQSFLIKEVFQHLTNTEGNNIENEKQVEDEASCATKLIDEEMVENSQVHKMSETCKINESHKDINQILENKNEGNSQENQAHLPDVPDKSSIAVQGQELFEEDQGKARSTSCIGGEEQKACNIRKRATRHEMPVQDEEEMRKIKSRKPNILPLVPDPEPEKVNLKHPMMDARKNTDEWMLDFALRQAVTNLAPTRKRKVALLVEAFESVMPVPKCEARMRNTAPFGHARPIQACS